MITESDVYQDNRSTALAWALLLSFVFNVAGWMLGLWIFYLVSHFVRPQPQEREYEVASTSVTLYKRVIPQPQRVAPRTTSQSMVQPAPQPQREAIHEQPRPLVSQAPHPPTLAQRLAMQQQEFERTANAMHAANQPLSIATIAPKPPTAIHRSYMDLNGVDSHEHVEAVLVAIDHWNADGMSCYYVRYTAQFSGGGNEDGTIPWPVCYPVTHDAMLPLNRIHDLPIPSPPYGYRLPPGTPLSPLLREIYLGTIHR